FPAQIGGSELPGAQSFSNLFERKLTHLRPIACDMDHGHGPLYRTPNAKSTVTPRGWLVEATLPAWRARRVERAPEVPRGHRTIRPPFLADFRELFRGRQFSLSEGFSEAFLDPVVGHWPDIEPTQIEEEKHFRGPPSDPAHFGQALNDFFVGHRDKFATLGHRAVDRFRSQILQRRNLASGKSGHAQLLVRRLQNRRRIQRLAFPVKRSHSSPNGGGRLPTELLIGNRFRERVERPHEIVRGHVEAARSLDEGRKTWIRPGEMIDGLLHPPFEQ